MENEENYLPAVLPSGEVWEGVLEDGTFRPEWKVPGPVRKDLLLHVEEKEGKYIPIVGRKD